MNTDEKTLFLFSKTLDIIKMIRGDSISLGNIQNDFDKHYEWLEAKLDEKLQASEWE
ncbi:MULTISPECIES: hypothetical protein [Pectobacterium]|uniref:hypothetical protein n=1 Tax=Pectobacterium TaxID=122277 RepID=UPI000917FFAC|nr:hypothetical protein [Pectobacterium carotovorum]SHH66622.1 hypothetical protein SAMN05444147_11570 [Pectobacterium carotovorum]